MKVVELFDPRTAPIRALRGLLRIPGEPDPEAKAEEKLLKKLERER